MEHQNYFPPSLVPLLPLTPHSNQNWAPRMPIDQFPISSNPPPPQDIQPMSINQNNRSRSDECKMQSEIILENYMECYANSSSIENAIDQNCTVQEAEFVDELVKLSSELDFLNVENIMIKDPFEPNYETTQFCTEEAEMVHHNYISATFPSLIDYSGSLSDVANSYSATNSLETTSPSLNGAVATTIGEDNDSSKNKKSWSEHEHKLFLVGMEIFGKGHWNTIAKKVVITKTCTQLASHAQKYFLRQQLPIEERKRSSIHDDTTVDSELLLQVRERLQLPSLLPLMNNYPPPLQMLLPDQIEQSQPFNNYSVPIVQQPPSPKQQRFELTDKKLLYDELPPMAPLSSDHLYPIEHHVY